MQRRLSGFSFFWLFSLVSQFVLANDYVLGKTQVQAVHAGFKHDAIYGLCLNNSSALAVGEAGLILQSSDNGDTWSELDRFTENALLDVECHNGLELYVGQSGEIYRRTDQLVEAVPSGTDARLMSVTHSHASGLSVAVGAFGTILVSKDAGESWSLVTVEWFAVLNDYVDPHLYDVHVSDNGVVTVVGEFSLVLQSFDQGKSWITRQRGEPSLFGLNIDGSGMGYAVGQEGTLLRTADAGISWAPITTPTNDILLNVSSMGEDTIVATGMRQLIVSFDGGSNWSMSDSAALSMGWYQGLEVSAGGEIDTATVLLAGHQANILKLELQ